MPPDYVIQQFTQRHAYHDDKQHNSHSEKCPEPLAKDIFLQDIQACLSISTSAWKALAG